ncbi:MAG: hypothetical protein D6727_02505 [Gammaproteobacteria bacterium]|nr:MAG: hypothetical protein D6727_02505 [Gammaproteobacteria bacterium]
MLAAPAHLPEVLAAWGLEDASVRPLGDGLINLSFELRAPDGRRYALQRLHPVFPAQVNLDIDVVTRRLAACGMQTPRLLRSRRGSLWLDAPDGCWRLLTWVGGETRQSLSAPGEAREAGRLLARFHRCLDGLRHRFSNPRLGVHDTSRHLAALRNALARHWAHPQHAAVQPLAERILAAAAALPRLPVTPDRIVHGDPKINNMLFDPDSGAGIAMVDLDTVGQMPLPLELGDALRSWCNPAGENEPGGEFDAGLFAAALQGYLEVAGDAFRPEERQAVLPATLTIIVELAARFCADALEECYFGWDRARFASASEHNRLRAAGQLALARSLECQQARLQEIVSELLGVAA